MRPLSVSAPWRGLWPSSPRSPNSRTRSLHPRLRRPQSAAGSLLTSRRIPGPTGPGLTVGVWAGPSARGRAGGGPRPLPHTSVGRSCLHLGLEARCRTERGRTMSELRQEGARPVLCGRRQGRVPGGKSGASAGGTPSWGDTQPGRPRWRVDGRPWHNCPGSRRNPSRPGWAKRLGLDGRVTPGAPVPPVMPRFRWLRMWSIWDVICSHV